MVSALPLLRFHEIDALPLTFDSRVKNRGLFGFTCLARILSLGPGGFSGFLNQACEDVSEPFATVQAGSAISRLLDTFLKTRFGFARVVEKNGVGALVTLDDALGLYEGSVKSSLAVSRVASTIFDVTGGTTLRRVLQEMFSRRIRRVFVSGKSGFVWDRSIIEYLFSPSVLANAARDPLADPLETPVARLGSTRAMEIRAETPLREAASMLRAERGQCLVFDGKVVTPWDVLLKPWKAGRLRVI
jgi:hypothetical protein